MGLFVTPGVRPYTPKDEREKPEGERVVFDLAILTPEEFARVQDEALDEFGLGAVRRGTFVLALCRYGVRGVRGPGAPEFEAKAADSPHASDAFLGLLSGALRIELANELDSMNTLGDEEGKASGS